jgi:serine/threonine protein kinase
VGRDIFGTRIGDFELIEKIGGGGTGEVFLARQLSLGGRRVALKIRRPQFAENERFRQRFLREARNAGHLSNPHVVQVLYTALEHRGGEWVG